MLKPNVDVERHYTYTNRPGTLLLSKDGLRVCPGGPSHTLGDAELAICPVCGDISADYKERA